MGKIIAIANQKGGVGKTTTAVNLGTALSMKGKRTLLIDLDPQANMSEYLKFTGEEQSVTVNDIMYAAVTGSSAFKYSCSIHHNETNNVDFVPADINLANADYYMAQAIAREGVLKRALSSECFSDYDYILIDCLPSLGILLMNALTASDGIIIPVQTQKFALDGLQGLTQVYDQVRDRVNPGLELVGVLATMVENTNMSRTTADKLSERYGGKMFRTEIHKSVEAAYSSENGESLCLTKGSKLGAEYLVLADEVIERINYLP